MALPEAWRELRILAGLLCIWLAKVALPDDMRTGDAVDEAFDTLATLLEAE